MNNLKEILINLANDDTINKDYLKVGWRDNLLELAYNLKGKKEMM